MDFYDEIEPEVTEEVEVEVEGTEEKEPSLDSLGEETEVAEPEAEKEPEPEELKEIVVKVNGREVSVPNDEQTIKTLLSKGLAADEKFQLAAREVEKVTNLVKQLKEDPISILEHPSIGLNFEKIAEEYLYKKMMYSQMSPEDRTAHENYQELERLRKEKQDRDAYEKEQRSKAEKEEQERRLAAKAEEYRTNITNQIIEVIEQNKLPKSDWTVQRFGIYMQQAFKQGYNVSPKDVLQYVQRDYEKVSNQFRQHRVANAKPKPQVINRKQEKQEKRASKTLYELLEEI